MYKKVSFGGGKKPDLSYRCPSLENRLVFLDLTMALIIWNTISLTDGPGWASFAQHYGGSDLSYKMTLLHSMAVGLY